MLTNEEKERIAEEEQYRFQVRRKLESGLIVKRWIIGIAVISLLVLTVAIIHTIHKRCWFKKGITVTASFKSDYGLKRWADVKFMGNRIGTVKKINTFTNEKGTILMEAQIFLLSTEQGLVRQDSKVRIVNPVFGRSYVEVKQGSPYTPAVMKNDIISSLPPSPKETFLEWMNNLFSGK